MGTRWNATDLWDDELFMETAAIWRKRFAQKREELHLTQEAFKDLLNESLGANQRQDAPHYTQGVVSGWQNVGTKKQGDTAPIRKTLFPRYEILLHIAQVLGVSVGYLMGETDAQTFDEQKTAAYLGLPAEAVRAIRALMESAGDASDPDDDNVLSLLFDTPKFSDLLTCFMSMQDILSHKDPFWRSRQALINKYGGETIQRACALLQAGREPNDESSELYDAIQEIKQEAEREARYSDLRFLQYEEVRREALSAFEELLEELFPAPTYELHLLEFVQKLQGTKPHDG